MAVFWDNIKTILPNGDEVAYVFQGNRNQAGQCGPNLYNVGRQCAYLGGVASNTPNSPDGDSWGPGLPMEGMFPSVGEYVSVNITQANGNQYTICYKCLEIIDKNTFLTGTCTSCYSDGYGGNCSDVFAVVPPYPGDQNGCRYDNAINSQGLIVSFFNGLTAPGVSFVTYISPDCSDCTTPSGGPVPAAPLNFLQNCCDPSEEYQFSPTSSIATYLTNVGAAAPNALRADLYIGGAQTGMKCWSVGTHLNPQLIPYAYSLTNGNSVLNSFFEPNCQQLQILIQNNPTTIPCCGAPQTEWCCLTGVAGPPTTCTQVAIGTCNPSLPNYSAGPFQSQQLCLAAGCATVVDPPYECELPVAALINLQTKVKGFSDRRKKALVNPNKEEKWEKASKNTGESTLGGRKQVTTKSGGGTTDMTGGNQEIITDENRPPRGGGERPAPSGGGGY